MKSCPVCAAEWPADLKFCPNDGTTLRSAGGTDLVGSVIGGNYHIEKKLGEGGMGAVYLGKHVKMGRKSAIKVMSQSMAHDPESIARFNREATNAARISHPNVCAIYDFGETPEGLIFLAMEFIEGESLDDLIAREGTLPLDRATSILKQTADALQAAHDLEIVHRDLKPDNIMITQARGTDVVKVVDFGIAKAMGGEEGQKVTKTGLVVGTPEYMSPEQLSGDELDGRSDIYSLALVYFRMITGTLPFQADSAQETMIKRLTDEPLKLEAACPGAGYPAGLQAAIDRALQKFPGERYANAVQFAKDVTASVAGAPKTAARPQVDEAATQLIEAQDATVRLAKTEIAGAVAKAKPTPATATATPATPKPMASPAPPPKKAPVVPIAAAVVVLAAAGVTTAVVMKGGAAATNGGVLPESVQTTPQNVTGGTDTGQPQQQAGPSNPRGTKAGGDPVTTAGGTTPPPSGETGGTPGGGTPALDTAAVSRDLLAIIDQLDAADPAVQLAARERARGYYEDRRLTSALRAQAAANLGFAYFAVDSVTQACTWYRRANDLLPSDANRNLMNQLGCSP